MRRSNTEEHVRLMLEKERKWDTISAMIRKIMMRKELDERKKEKRVRGEREKDGGRRNVTVGRLNPTLPIIRCLKKGFSSP